MRGGLLLTVWVVSLAVACSGGTALQLTPTAMPAAEPAKATATASAPTPEPQPSVGALAFVTIEGSLWIRLTDGDRKLIYAPENGQVYYPEWSPDGGRIAFTEVDFADDFVEEGVNFSLADIMTVVVVDIEGKEILRVARAIMPHWSPDGRALAVGAEPDIEGMIILMTPSIVEVETGQLRHAVPRLRTLDSPRWSPDGNLLVYATDDGLYVIGSTEGSAPRGVVEAEAYSLFYLTPVWSADGAVLAFESDRRSGGPPGGVDSYVVVDGDRGIISRVGDSYPTKCGRGLFFRDNEAHWIPGTTFAAWGITCTDSKSKPGIWMKDMTGGEERFLDTSSVAKSVGLLDVSTDGRRIAFSSGTGGLGYTRLALPARRGLTNIYVVGIEGGEPELLVEDARFPTWQPQPFRK